MQLITYKIMPPSASPPLSAAQAKKLAYRLGVSFCPTMDLIATYPILSKIKSSTLNGTGTEVLEYVAYDSEEDRERDAGVNDTAGGDEEEESLNVDVWRFNGQRVFSIAIESSTEARLRVLRVEWRSDGQIIAVLSSDNIIRLVNSFSGKIVHRLSSVPTYAAPASPRSTRTRRAESAVSVSSSSKPSSLSYTTHFWTPRPTWSLLHTADDGGSITLDDLLGLNADMSSLLRLPADLPRELANIDVESFLPRLSCLPPMGFGGEDVFSTRTSIDTIFHSSRKNTQSGAVDVLVAGSTDATLTIRIFDSFELGGIDLNSANGMPKGLRVGRIVDVVSWPFASQLLIFAEDAEESNLHLLDLDLKFITQSSHMLPVLATKATQLQNLLRYLDQIQTQLARDVKAAFDLPSRYLRNLDEDLEKQDGTGSSFATAAYHTIVTGEVSGAFKEWLNDQVGERGVKRWEKSVGDCLELSRRLISEAWCPAVERAGVVVSRLGGLAGWVSQDDSERPKLGLSRRVVESIQDTIDVMAVCGEVCLKEVVKEANSFASFIKWLKWEVEASALEDTSERLDEMRESSDHGDLMKVLEYIEHGPQEGVAKRYLQSTTTTLEVNRGEEQNFYSSFKEKRRRSGAGNTQPTFDQLLRRMHHQCDQLFESIAHHLQQGVMTRYLTQVNAEIDTSLIASRIIPSKTTQKELSSCQVHVISCEQNDERTFVCQVIDAVGVQSKLGSSTVSRHQTPQNGRILDVKFVDDENFMVLTEAATEINIYQGRIETGQTDMWELRHRFEHGLMQSGMKPAHLVVNGRKKRRVVGVVDANGKGYAVFDLDSGDTEQEADNKEEDEEEEEEEDDDDDDDGDDAVMTG